MANKSSNRGLSANLVQSVPFKTSIYPEATAQFSVSAAAICYSARTTSRAPETVFVSDYRVGTMMGCFFPFLDKRSSDDSTPDLDPVLLISGIGGSIMNSKPKKFGLETRVWVRILFSDLEFKKNVWSVYNPKTGTQALSLISQQVYTHSYV